MQNQIPLPGPFLLIGIFGFIVSVLLWSSGTISDSWAFTFAILSMILFISSMISSKQDAVYHHVKARINSKK